VPAAVAEAVRTNEINASRLEAQLERARLALAEARAESRAAARSEPPALSAATDRRSVGDRQRNCRELLSRASIGDSLSSSESEFLKQECK
jgi:hypothetical protein